MKRTLLGLVIALLLTGCAPDVPEEPAPTPTQHAPDPAPTPVPSPTKAIDRTQGERTEPFPGEFRIRYGQEELLLDPDTYCYSDGDEDVCVDGYDPDPHSAGTPDEIFVFVPVPDFTDLTVHQTIDGDDCTGEINAVTEPLGSGWWRVLPSGPSAEYRVTIAAGRDGAGDMIASILWHTPAGGPLPEPDATIAVVTGDDTGLDSSGVEMYLQNLASTPKQAAATVTVTAAGGESLTFTPENLQIGCDPIGALFWYGPDGKGEEAAELGELPYTVRVDLVLDGVAHTATSTYPDDAVPGDVFLPLSFTPPLD